MSAQEAVEGFAQLGGELRCGHAFGLGVGVGLGAAGDAMLHVMGEQFDPQGIQGGAHGGDLAQHVEAIAVAVDHALDALNLTGDAFETRLGVAFSVRVHCPTYTP